MSVKIMGLVWDTQLPPNERYVLLAYADHADHYGKNIYPAIRTVAAKTGYSERQVQRITGQLETKGYLVPDGAGPHGTNKWAVPMRGDKLSPRQFVTKGVTPTSPKPSLKPSDNEEEVRPTQNIYTLYENVVGPINSLIADELKDAEERFPWEWIVEAFKEAATKNARNWKYIYTILDRWEREGFQTDNRENGSKKKAQAQDDVKDAMALFMESD